MSFTNSICQFIRLKFILSTTLHFRPEPLMVQGVPVFLITRFWTIRQNEAFRGSKRNKKVVDLLIELSYLLEWNTLYGATISPTHSGSR